MQRLRLYHVWMSLRSHMMCFEGMGRLMEGKKKKKSYKAVQHIDSVIFRCGSYVHAFVLVLVFAVF